MNSAIPLIDLYDVTASFLLKRNTLNEEKCVIYECVLVVMCACVHTFDCLTWRDKI